MHYGFNERQMKILSSSIAKQFIDKRRKGGKELSYVTHSYIAEMLDAVFDGCWSFEITDRWEESAIVFPSDRDNKNVARDEHGNILPVQGKTVMHVICKLTVPLYPQPDVEGEFIPDNVANTPIWITKMGAGAAVGDGNADVQKDKYKSASMDALKKAATLLGMGRELYMDDDDENYGDLATFRQWVNSIAAESSWTPYDNMKHAEDLEMLNTIYSELSMSEDAQEDAIYKFLTETKDISGNITPKNIHKFVQWLLKKIQTEEKEE